MLSFYIYKEASLVYTGIWGEGVGVGGGGVGGETVKIRGGILKALKPKRGGWGEKKENICM